MSREAPMTLAVAAIAATFYLSPCASAQTFASDRTGAGPRDAVARVAFAEAGDQGDSGLAAVVRVILNRLMSGEWGASVDSVLNAKNQFEPVANAGGDWRRLAPVSAAQRARIDTIINLTLDGRLPDLTNGARYFQNPALVASRVRLGEARSSLLRFGMSTPTAVIGDHWFFRTVAARPGQTKRTPLVEASPIFVTGSRAVTVAKTIAGTEALARTANEDPAPIGRPDSP